eukprot:Nitzschia sp. Nitz4//scaffold7_size249615//126225//126833//NITZ4_001178-RA/size249615-processed-gene-0.143-mRNA-1//1//CDS//3329558445//1953//frame0
MIPQQQLFQEEVVITHDFADVKVEEGEPHLPQVKSVSQLSELSAETVATDFSESEFDADRHVSFGGVTVREYERVVGDHPDTKIGVPLAIGWAFVEREEKPLAKYEDERVFKGKLRMSSITRKNILHNVFGIPEEEIRVAEKEVQKIRKQRDWSTQENKVGAKTKSAFKSFKKTLKKAVSAEAFLKGLSAAASGGMMTPSMS